MKDIGGFGGSGLVDGPTQVARRGVSRLASPGAAVDELAAELAGPDLGGVVFFASPSYDLDELGRAVRSRFDCPVVGCTTAGEILSPFGYLEDSLVGVGFASPDISFTPVLIPSLEELVSGTTSGHLALSLRACKASFALLLVDGLSLMEERVTATIHRHLEGVPLIGGSAGDGRDFRRTHVYHDGRFHSGAAVLVLFGTSLPFKTFRIHHFEPTETKLVITEASTARREVREINGLPAAPEYARIVGVAPEKLCLGVYAAHPLMLRVGGEYFVRSIMRANPDDSLTFYCAIDNGLVLTVAKPSDFIASLERRLAALRDDLGGLELVLGCDCILRRQELELSGAFDRAREVLARYPFIGFSTYGEQSGGIHVNQTLTGLALGREPRG